MDIATRESAEVIPMNDLSCEFCKRYDPDTGKCLFNKRKPVSVPKDGICGQFKTVKGKT